MQWASGPRAETGNQMLATAKVRSDRVDLEKVYSCFPEVAEAVRKYDSQLVIYWDKCICRWSLARITKNGVFQVKTWANEDNSYRPLSMELIGWLQKSDWWKNYGKPDELSRALRDDQEGYEKKIHRDFDDDVGHILRSNKVWVQKVRNLLDLSGSFVGD